MARTAAAKNEDTKPVKKISAREQEFRSIVNELSVVFSDLSMDEIKTLAKMNMIADLRERGSAIEYFWVAKKLNS